MPYVHVWQWLRTCNEGAVMRVSVIGYTSFVEDMATLESDGQWDREDDTGDASSLIEFAGRQCYESWARPNPETATNAGYIKNILAQQHLSVLEHGSVSFRISDVSRSLTHELVRHRHLSPSQLSQRFVKPDRHAFTVPPLYADDAWSQSILQDQWADSVTRYDQLISVWMPRLLQAGHTAHRARKMAQEAARAVLPNMTPTALVLTGNHRSWREFLEKRGSIHADAEIRQLAVLIHRYLMNLEPALYQDFTVSSDKTSGELVVGRENG